MSGLILIVDRDKDRRSSLERVLHDRYLNTIGVDNPNDALAILTSRRPALALLAVDGEDPAELDLCRRLKRLAKDLLPILVYTTNELNIARCTALHAGADDLLVFPRDEALLLARTRSMLRVRTLVEEVGLREKTAADLGFTPSAEKDEETALRPLVLLVAPENERTRDIAHKLAERGKLTCEVAPTGFGALRLVETRAPDAIVISGAASLDLSASGFSEGENPNELIRAIATTDAGRRAAVLYLADDGARERARIAAALDAGAVDCAFLDDEAEELLIRLGSHLRRKRYGDILRSTLADGLQDSVKDPLTGLHNRRYLDAHFKRRIDAARKAGEPLSVIIFDLDQFKSINDQHGHMAGDAALIAFASVLRDEVRVADLVCRYGGEEFVVVLPGADYEQAAMAAERVNVRLKISRIPEINRCRLTVSAGVAEMNADERTGAGLLNRADNALRRAKLNGRDQVAVA